MTMASSITAPCSMPVFLALRREPALAHSYMRARHHSRPAMAGFRAIARAVKALAHDGRLP